MTKQPDSSSFIDDRSMVTSATTGLGMQGAGIVSRSANKSSNYGNVSTTNSTYN